MTFEEAFNSGCRFKLPPFEDSEGLENFPNGFYWQRHSEKRIKICWNGYDQKGDYIDDIFIEHEGKLLKNRTDWELHPDDEHRMKFKEKMEDLINGF